MWGAINVIRREYPSWRRTLLSSSWFWQGERGCWSSSRYFSNIVQIFFKCLSNIFKCLTKAEYQIFNLFIFSDSIHPSPVHERGWKYPQWYWRRFYPWVLHRKMWRWWQPPSRSSFLGLPWWYILAYLHPCSCSCIFAMMVNTLETFTIKMYMNFIFYSTFWQEESFIIFPPKCVPIWNWEKNLKDSILETVEIQSQRRESPTIWFCHPNS